MPEPDETGADGRQPLAFISHHSSQVEQARHISRILGRHGIKGWMAPDDIEPGQAFDQVIIEQIGKCDVILLLFSASSDQSKHVKREVMLAEQQGKLIYPIRLESIQPDGLAYWLQDYQWIDWLDGRDDAIERMVATIRRQLSLTPTDPAPAPQPVPPAPPVQRHEADPAPAPDPAPGRKNLPVVLGAIGGGLVAVLLLGYALMGETEDPPLPEPAPFPTEEPGEVPGEEDAKGVSDVPAASAGAVALQAGSWQVRYRMTGFSSDFPGANRRQAASLVSAYSGTACVGAMDAADPGRTVLAVFTTGQPSCEIDSGPSTGGNIEASAECRNPADGTYSMVDAEGTYTAGTASVEYDVTQWLEALGPGQTTEMSVVMSARRVGGC